jgi:hypothetical protein
MVLIPADGLGRLLCTKNICVFIEGGSLAMSAGANTNLIVLHT